MHSLHACGVGQQEQFLMEHAPRKITRSFPAVFQTLFLSREIEQADLVTLTVGGGESSTIPYHVKTVANGNHLVSGRISYLTETSMFSLLVNM